MKQFLTLVACLFAKLLFAQEIETETARLLPKNGIKLGTAFEFQTSKDGKEFDVPLVFEYGIHSRLELTLEPVFFTDIIPTIGKKAKGIGDFEATLTYLITRETRDRPAFAIAGEFKFPTASNFQIGTSEPDYGVYLIGSKKFNNLDLHANINYTVIGSPDTVHLHNIFFFAMAGKYNVDRTVLFAEIFGNTSSLREGDSATESKVIPEAAGGEVVGTFGVGHYLKNNLLLSFSISYDNHQAVLFRPSLSYKTTWRHHSRKLTDQL